MNTNQAAYWIALGVLALGLNSEYRQGNFVTVHRIVERAGSALCQITVRAEETLTVAKTLTSGEKSPVDNLLASTGAAEMARSQGQLLREQAREQADLIRGQVRDQILAQRDVVRAQTEIRRAEIEQIRLRTRSEFRLASIAGRRVTVVCPKTGARMVVNAGPEFGDAFPEIEVKDTF
jgi:hypothetical protein